jgi:hypothetical protein
MGAVTEETLIKAKEVTDTESDPVAAQATAPSTGATVWVRHFEWSAAFSLNSVVVLEWGDDSGGWETIWSGKGDRTLTKPIEITAHLNAANGTRKVRLRLSNGESGDVYLSGLAEVEWWT